MLPVTAPLPPTTGLTVVTTLSWSYLVKRFTNRCSFSASSQSSKAPAQVKQQNQTKMELLGLQLGASDLYLTWIWRGNNPLLSHPADVCDAGLRLHTSFAESFAGGLLGLTVDPYGSLPVPAREVGGTNQQGAICEERTVIKIGTWNSHIEKSDYDPSLQINIKHLTRLPASAIDIKALLCEWLYGAWKLFIFNHSFLFKSN